ncbi:MAG: protein disulfide oxidoreductase [Candidatus Ranarchaeia archaeon]|jgi:glutaredoxin-like protein
MSFISDTDRQKIRDEYFSKLEEDVKLVYFTQENECMTCNAMNMLYSDIAKMSDKINLEVYDFVKDVEKKKLYDIDKIPALAVVGKKDYGVRFYGSPIGYEFTPLILSIIDVSLGKTSLAPPIKTKLKDIDKPVHIQVFTSPTCPLCPTMVKMAHNFAIENDNIRADMVETTEFIHLTIKYDVQGVPKTIINETSEVVGLVTPVVLLQKIIKDLGEAAQMHIQ